MLVPSKKNQKELFKDRNGKFMVAPSAQFGKWKRMHQKVFSDFHDQLINSGVNLPIVRCKIKVLFYFPDSKKRDLSNKFETIMDELVDHEIVIDDQFQVVKPVVLDGFVCRDRPRTEIYITIITADMPEYEWDITNQAKHSKATAERRAIKEKIRRAKKKEATPHP